LLNLIPPGCLGCGLYLKLHLVHEGRLDLGHLRTTFEPPSARDLGAPAWVFVGSA
jgi:hypothetical protein